MTNREHMINLLKNNDINDSAYQIMLRDIMACPYTIGDPEAQCSFEHILIAPEKCIKCIQDWLDLEVGK